MNTSAEERVGGGRLDARGARDPASPRYLIVGAGGLGGPIACALAAAGAGEIAVCDPDEVETSNLQRQIQFATADVGRPKAETLVELLARRGYPRARALPRRFEPESAAALSASSDVLIDGSDDLATKFAVSDEAAASGRPAVVAGVVRYTGQVLPVWPGAGGCYRCLFEAPPEHEPESCAEAGVLGAAVAVIAGAAARAALALAAGDRSEAGILDVYDDLRAGARPRRVRFEARPDCPACGRPPGAPPPATRPSEESL